MKERTPTSSKESSSSEVASRPAFLKYDLQEFYSATSDKQEWSEPLFLGIGH